MPNKKQFNSINLISILKSQARKEALWGVYIAFGAIITATILICLIDEKTLSVSGIVDAHKNNFALIVLDFLAFFFPLWGQYSSQVMAYEANELFREHSEELMSRANRLEKEKNFVATHDPVTELPNKSLFFDRLENSIRIASSNNSFQGIYYLQINNLKEVSEALGSNASDLVVKQLGIRLVKCMSAIDTVARIESDVFAILDLNVQNEMQCEENIRRLQKAIEPSFEVSGLKISLQTQIGITHFPEHAQDAESLMQKVGIAVYKSMKSHTGYAIYSPEFDSSSPKSLTLMGDLVYALEDNQFEIHYQPKLDLRTKQITGAESLVRWNYSQHGVICPNDFIKLIERTHMMKTFTQWIIEKTFSDVAKWNSEGLELIISINLSPKDLHDPQLPDRILGSMARFNVNPKFFMFEITEGSIMIDPERVLGVLHRLNGLGFGISIDDFGTGYSSMSYLKRMPVSEIKVDKSFVMEMLTSESDSVIVKATIDLAHNLGMKVTAEGIEEEGVMKKLEAFGCDLIQGFYISHGLKEADFLKFLAESKWGPRQSQTKIAA